MSDVSYYEIPTQPTAQFFSISLAGVTYFIKLQWCAPSQCWIMEISDSNQDLLVGGVPLITGADLLDQLAYLGFGGSMFVQSDFDPDEVPDYASLGSTGHLYFSVPPL